jgi:hypothetical protein
MKSAIVLAAALTAVALGACRKEVEHQPMKLGGPSALEQAVR